MSARILIHKRGASGDVLRTTTILTLFGNAAVDWMVDEKNAPLLVGTSVRVVTSPVLLRSRARYDLIVSLEESRHDLEEVYDATTCREIVGTYLDKNKEVRYTDSSRGWFDMSLISSYDMQTANRLKFENRASFQEHLFRMFGQHFAGQPYHRFGPPKKHHGPLPNRYQYRILLAVKAGPRWPNKEWAHFDKCHRILARRWSVSVLEQQPSLFALAQEIARYDLIVANDSLPMHIALSQGGALCALFTCTSPWEIYDYAGLSKIVSPKLEKYYYLNSVNYEARSAISVEVVVSAVEMFAARHTESQAHKQRMRSAAAA
jgi:heptosyltransferase II